MNKGKFILSIVLIGVLCVTGCQREKEVKEHKELGWSVDTMPPEYISETINENFIIDADVCVLPGFEQGTADVLNVEMDTFNRKAVTDVLTENNVIISEEKEEYEDGTTSLYYELSNGDHLYISDRFVSYTSALSEYIFYCTRLAYGQVGENREVFEATETDFAYCSIEEAEKTGADLLERLGIPVYESGRYKLRLHHEVLKQEEDPIVMEGLADEYNPKPKGEWTSADDSYYFEFYQTVDGCGIIPEVYTPESTRVYTPLPVKMILNEEGIVEISSDSRWVCREIIEKEQPLINFQTALDMLKKKYEHVITEDLLEVEKIELGYAGLRQGVEDGWENHMIAAPVWVFRVKRTTSMHGNEITSSYTVIFDAVTGEEIL